MPPSVTVTIVTHNSGPYIEKCLRSVFRRAYPALDLVVVATASTDSTREILARFEGAMRIHLNVRIVGFAAEQNQAIASSAGDWVLVLNPDAALQPDFVQKLVEGGLLDTKVGT